MDAKRRYTLALSCPDRVGIVAAVSGFLAQHQGWIVEASHHADYASARFFMRQEILAESLAFDLDELRRLFVPIAEAFGMDWRVTDSAVRHRVVLMVSREDHCLNDLLYRWRAREFGFDVVCVISNHDALRAYVEWHGIPYHLVPVTPETKPKAFAEVLRLFGQYQGDTLVLARYMQILPPEVCAALPGRIVNIHHSFLPSFAGARPYHQAYARGVKLIGATCHYVTADLDAGPIIEQDTVRVDHGDFVEDLVRYGRDIEKAVLARGLRYHVEGRVLLDATKTVVFR